jgi:hypothetical protein
VICAVGARRGIPAVSLNHANPAHRKVDPPCRNSGRPSHKGRGWTATALSPACQPSRDG